MRLTAAAHRKVPFRGRAGPLAAPASIPASVGGWDKSSALAKMPADRAVLLDNFIPRPGYLEIRRGYQEWCTGVGGATDPVESLMAYNGVTSNKMFAAAVTTIYDVTSQGAGSATTVTTLTNARLQHVNFTNSSGNHYLFVANGQDTPQIYDGSVWAGVSITISGFNSADIIQPNAHKGRIWFVLNNSTKVAYMALGAISGTATTFELGSFMTRGGYVMAMATWSIDTRQTVDDYAVFITSRGQVIVYEGTDPSSADSWTLIGIYDIGPPIGRRCFLRVAGDLAIISIDGILPMSQMLSTDRTAANRVSITAIIMNAMAMSAQLYSGNFGWQMIAYPKGTLAILNIPITENETQIQYAMNTLTGAWCRFLGIDANCWETLNDNIFFGGNDGTVYQWDFGSGDNDDPITATVETAFSYFGSRGRLKRFTMVRPIITTDGSVTPGVGLNVDFGTGAEVSTPSTVSNFGAQWDVAQWDEDSWGVEGAVVANWTSISGIGQCASIITTVTTIANGNSQGVLLQLNSWDLTYEAGGIL